MPSTLAENVVILYLVHIFNYLVPLLMIPYLTRHLGLTGWGEFALAEALARYTTLFIEYGFSLSGTREVAREASCPEARSSLLGRIIAAQITLAGASLLLALVMSQVLPGFRSSPLLFWSGIAWGVLDAFNLMWYFQGIERTRIVGVIDIGARMFGVLLVFAFVQHPADGWKAFCFRAIASLISLGFCLRVAYRDMPVRWPDIAGTHQMLREGFSMFLLRSSINIYLLANVIILGFFVSPQIVGVYSGAEKISRAAIAMLNPITQAVYPRVSRMVHAGKSGAASLVRVSLAIMGLGGMLTALVVFVTAPVLVRVLLGKDFGNSVLILRLLCLLHPIVALNSVLGIQWLIPNGLEKVFNIIMIVAGAINIALGILLVPKFLQFGTVWSTVSAEVVMFVWIVLTCSRLEINPLSLKSARQNA